MEPLSQLRQLCQEFNSNSNYDKVRFISNTCNNTPAYNIICTPEKGTIIEASVAGCGRDCVSVTIDNDSVLNINAKMPFVDVYTVKSYAYSFNIPPGFRVNKATVANGMCTVIIDKIASQSKTIPIS